MNVDESNKIGDLNHKLMFSNAGPVALAVDTYEELKKIYSKEEALELTKIVCENYYKQLSIEKEDIDQ